MTSARKGVVLAILAAGCVLAGPQGRGLTAQAPGRRTYRARLSTVPMSVAMASTIAGRGSATATLSGRTLIVDGTFEGLRSSATVAQIRHAKPGLRGPVLFDLVVSPKGDGRQGTFSGRFELDASRLAELEEKRLYIQLHSEQAADGNLRGWLFPQVTPR